MLHADRRRPITMILMIWVLLPFAHAQSVTEKHAARAFYQASQQGQLALRAFLYKMPKGADLHVHLGGAVYAETILRDAGEDHLCVNEGTLSLEKPLAESKCPKGDIPASTAPDDQHLYDELIDAFSMRTFVPTTGDSGHDHFFDSFDKYSGLEKRHMGEWIDEVASNAAAQNEQYLELMFTPDFKTAAALAVKEGFNPDFVQYREQLLSQGLRAGIPAIRKSLDAAEADRRAREHCSEANAQPACKIAVRYLVQVSRGKPPAIVFAQILLAFELASVDPRVVGLNLVMPEDGYIAMRDYRLHMRMLDALHGLYPKAHISLHAGELAPGMVPPEGLTFHIRSAVEQGHAERIGHGVDVMYEDRPYELLKEMVARHIMVEINLTSNDAILNVKGDEHPLPLYLKYHVPVALSTDDEGVSRIDLTHEYVNAALTYHLSYQELKQMARTSVEHSFLPGADLWEAQTCRPQLGRNQPSGACATLVRGSEKAQQEWELERRFHTFETSF